MAAEQTPGLVHYLPIASTVLSAIFCSVLLRRWLVRRSGAHLLWWGIGIFFYGLGTGLESAITLFGNTAWLTKTWYVAGALLGGYPLAQGTVFLLLRWRTAWILTAITLPFLAVAATFVLLSPVDLAQLEAHRPSGSVLVWSWVRLLTPFINLYAVVFLIGGAILSSIRYARGRTAAHRARALGNASIAFGAILPGIGGSMAKAGLVEALYVGELIGLLFIWAGFALCVRAPMGAGASADAEARRTADDPAPAAA
ncbi:MAG: hypothetical protein DWQ36_25355 [Acidobacteria bacterium]|nr:MAG: hypothetical protein DWQ30_25370 [Acidobacteriota bacterium]REJ99486.1 MAG: hypothetical protein DWQ36_25355 [Acidobacteriota bacterium]